jgi:hypothetical protein
MPVEGSKMAKKQPKKAADGPGLLTPFMGPSTTAGPEGHRDQAGKPDTGDGPGLGKQAMFQVYEALGADWEPEEGVKEAGHDGEGSCGEGKCGEGTCAAKKKKKTKKKKLTKKAMPFLQQDRPAKVKEVYRALERDHPEYSAGKKARIASSMAKKADKKEFAKEINSDANKAKADEMLGFHSKQNFGKSVKEMSRHEKAEAGELVMNHPHFQKIMKKHNITSHDIVSGRTDEDISKKAAYVPESEKMHRIVAQHSRLGHKAEAKRLMAEGGKKGGRKGAGIGAAAGSLLGAAAGAHRSGMDPKSSGAAALGGAALGALAGKLIGARPGRKRGLAEAERRQDAVEATKKMTKDQRINYFQELSKDRRHEDKMSSKGKLRKEALMQTSIQDSPSHRAGVVAGMESAAKCDPELQRHLDDANARNWPVGRAATSMKMSESGEFKTHD